MAKNWVSQVEKNRFTPEQIAQSDALLTKIGIDVDLYLEYARAQVVRTYEYHKSHRDLMCIVKTPPNGSYYKDSPQKSAAIDLDKAVLVYEDEVSFEFINDYVRPKFPGSDLTSFSVASVVEYQGQTPTGNRYLAVLYNDRT